MLRRFGAQQVRHFHCTLAGRRTGHGLSFWTNFVSCLLNMAKLHVYGPALHEARSRSDLCQSVTTKNPSFRLLRPMMRTIFRRHCWVLPCFIQFHSDMFILDLDVGLDLDASSQSTRAQLPRPAELYFSAADHMAL